LFSSTPAIETLRALSSPDIKRKFYPAAIPMTAILLRLEKDLTSQPGEKETEPHQTSCSRQGTGNNEEYFNHVDEG
jgi:hypothetical protein